MPRNQHLVFKLQLLALVFLKQRQPSLEQTFLAPNLILVSEPLLPLHLERLRLLVHQHLEVSVTLDLFFSIL